MADLIGAPLNAACDAQVRLAKATADFVNTVGFNPVGDGDATKLVPRQVDFAFWRPVGPMAPVEGGGSEAKVEKVQVSVPFLALVNVPALAIKSVDITFDMEVKSSESSRESQDMGAKLDATMRVGWGPFSANVKVSGSISTHKENTRSTDKSAKYHVEVHARDDGMPEGLARVLDMLQSAIAPVAISKQVSPAAADIGKLQAPVTNG
ncbi:MAG TPA: DUF2589 domain-containing protein [Nannocystis sp.]